MAASDFVSSAKVKIREGDVGANRANSEAVNQKISGSINALIDSSFYDIDVEYTGYYSNSSRLFTKAPIKIEKQCDIIFYQLSIHDTGSGAGNSINFNIYDDTGAFVNTLFGSGANKCLISGNNGSNAMVSKNLDTATDSTTNTAGHTIQYGVLNATTLQAGWLIVPFIQDFSTAARSIRFSMRVREQ